MPHTRDEDADLEYAHDEGLELREEFIAKLEASIKSVETGEPTIPAEEVYCRLGLG